MNAALNSIGYNQLLMQFSGCEATSSGGLIISDAEALDRVIKDLLIQMQLEVKSTLHQFPSRVQGEDGGVTNAWIATDAKSGDVIYLTAHTWPEYGRSASLDLRVNNAGMLGYLSDRLQSVFDAKHAEPYTLKLSPEGRLELEGKTCSNTGQPLGKHWIAVYNGCREMYPDEIQEPIKDCISIVKAGELGFLKTGFRRPSKGLLSLGIQVISESHFALECYKTPNRHERAGCTTVFNFYTCNGAMPGEETVRHMASVMGVGAGDIQLMELARYTGGIKKVK